MESDWHRHGNDQHVDVGCITGRYHFCWLRSAGEHYSGAHGLRAVNRVLRRQRKHHWHYEQLVFRSKHIDLDARYRAERYGTGHHHQDESAALYDADFFACCPICRRNYRGQSSNSSGIFRWRLAGVPLGGAAARVPILQARHHEYHQSFGGSSRSRRHGMATRVPLSATS